MRKTRLLLTVLSLSAAFSSTALAGTWQSDSTGWWYQNDDGTYPENTRQWIDGNGDGISENYYFDADGYCLTNTTTPDGSTVNANGALTVNGIVQTQVTPAKPLSHSQLKQKRRPFPSQLPYGYQQQEKNITPFLIVAG